MRTAGRSLLLLLSAAAAASCGYRYGPVAPINGALTVQIPLFENRTFRREVESDLARQIAAAVASRSRLRLVDAGGDLVVEGALTDIREIVLTEREDENIRESSVLVSAEVTVRDGRTGEPVVKLRKIFERESFVPGIGESLRSARIEALKRMAADVVDLLEAR